MKTIVDMMQTGLTGNKKHMNFTEAETFIQTITGVPKLMSMQYQRDTNHKGEVTIKCGCIIVTGESPNTKADSFYGNTWDEVVKQVQIFCVPVDKKIEPAPDDVQN